MRLRITRALSGSIDGTQLSHFVVGGVYDVGTSIGSFLLSVGAAKPAQDERQVEEKEAHSAPPARLRDKAADFPTKRRRHG